MKRETSLRLKTTPGVAAPAVVHLVDLVCQLCSAFGRDTYGAHRRWVTGEGSTSAAS